MSDSDSRQLESTNAHAKQRLTPSDPIGWWAIALVVIALAAWVILPMITIRLRETYPVTDTWVMPVIGLVLSDVAAGFNALYVWRRKERSVLNIIAVALIIPVAVFVTYLVIGESLAGV